MNARSDRIVRAVTTTCELVQHGKDAAWSHFEQHTEIGTSSILSGSVKVAIRRQH